MEEVSLPLHIREAINYFNSANHLFNENRHNEAAVYYKHAISLYPNYFEAFLNLGICLNALKDYDQAREALEIALELRPENFFVLYELGYNRQLAERHSSAIPYYERAYLFDKTRDLLMNLGVAYSKIKRFDLSKKILSETVSLCPEDSVAHYNLSKTLIDLKEYEEAKKELLKTIEISPNFASAHINLGDVYYGIDKDIDKAIDYFQGALALEKNNNNNLDLIYYNLGNCYKYKLDNKNAIFYYQKAIQIKPDMVEAHWNLSLAFFAENNYEEGFKEYTWRWKRPKTFTLHIAKPLWHGEDITDKVLLVHTEQGFGDSLMFIRFLPFIKPMAKKLILATNNELLDLFKNNENVDEIIPRSAINDNLDRFDCYVPLLNIPSVLNTTLDTIPVAIPYLSSDKELTSQYDIFFEAYKNFLKIGFAWKTNPGTDYSLQKSCDFDKFRTLFDLDGFKFFALQREFKELPLKHDNCINLADKLTSFAQTAAILEHLDLIITVDTALSHLSGAMGKNTWTVVPYHYDWRWGVDGTKSPWYPEMKLFRQAQNGDWKEVFTRIKHELLNFQGKDK